MSFSVYFLFNIRGQVIYILYIYQPLVRRETFKIRTRLKMVYVKNCIPRGRTFLFTKFLKFLLRQTTYSFAQICEVKGP